MLINIANSEHKVTIFVLYFAENNAIDFDLTAAINLQLNFSNQIEILYGDILN